MPPKPLILGFDTSAAHCAAALLSGDTVLGSFHAPMTKGQVEHLMPLLENLLAEAGHTWADLTALGVGVGPGNFTGIRIAVSAARGLAVSLDIPAVGVTAFEALAHDLPTPVLATVDARRGQAYACVIGRETEEPMQTSPDTLPADMAGLNCVGHASTDFAAQTSGDPLPPRYPLAESIARIAAKRWQTTTTRPAPLYLRAADAAPASDPPPVILP